MNYNINTPWNTLDEWQKEYIFNTHPDENCFLLCGRQVGKTTAMSIRAVELCINHYKKGEFVLINSITEKQAYHMLAKALSYAQAKYSREIKKGKDRPTMHKILFKNGTGILCYAAGETGEGLRGFTIKKLMPDEGSRMSEEYYIATLPMLSVINGSIDIASTPAGKLNKDGKEKYFYKCSKDPRFKKFYVSSEDCPRHSKEFLNEQKENLPKLAYAQEYLAIFTDVLKRLFSEELINKRCSLKRRKVINTKTYLGVDVAGLGKDECTYEVLDKINNNEIIHRESIIEKRNLTTDTARRILILNKEYNFKKIGVDDGGVGFGVYSELMNNDETKRKTEALNNASRPINKDGTRSKKILKEEMYLNLLSLMESGRIKLLDDDEVKASLSSIQHDEGKIFGSYSHIAEGLIRSAWLAKDKDLNIFAHTF
jgi:hypothetical protein